MRLFSRLSSADFVVLSLTSLLLSSFVEPPLAQARHSDVEKKPFALSSSVSSSLKGFGGRALLVLSEGDQSATAYADGLLDRPEGVADTLTVLTSPSDHCRVAATLAVSNSVLGWPQALAVAPDGKHAI